MTKSHAYRNIKLCTKDCLCLFVCPTGATNTETGQIDFEKCIGCGACANACPSRAITMIPNILPKIQPKNNAMVNALFTIADNKIKENQILNDMLNKVANDEQKLIKALIHSNTVIIEDLMREAGYMIPQSPKSQELLTKLAANNSTANKILETIKPNE